MSNYALKKLAKLANKITKLNQDILKIDVQVYTLVSDVLSGVGVKNVERRLARLSGEKYSLNRDIMDLDDQMIELAMDELKIDV